MMNGSDMKKDLMQASNPQECSLCTQSFLTPQGLISHSKTFHPNHHFSSSAAAAPTTSRHYLNQNPIPAFQARNPNPAFQAGNPNRFRRCCYVGEQERFRNGLPTISPASRTNFSSPELMNLFPAASSEGLRTLPLICQLEKRIPHDTTMERGGAISNSDPIDLTLRL